MLLRSTVALAAAFVGMGIIAGPAAAQEFHNPANFGNVPNVERGNSAPGPHCHINLRAREASGKIIVTAAAHQGHTGTTGVFAATACP